MRTTYLLPLLVIAISVQARSLRNLGRDFSHTDWDVLTSNVIKNGGFETGNTDGWQWWGVDAEKTEVIDSRPKAHSGRYFLKLQKDDDEGIDYGLAKQELSEFADWDDIVLITAWVKKTRGSDGDPYLSIFVKERGTHEQLSGQLEPGRKKNVWEQLVILFTIPSRDELPDLSKVYIDMDVGVMGSGYTDPIFIDDVHIGILKRGDDDR